MPIEVDFLEDKIEYLLCDALPAIIFPHKIGNQSDLISCINNKLKPDKEFTSRAYSDAKIKKVYKKEERQVGRIDKKFLVALGTCFQFKIEANEFLTGTVEKFKKCYICKHKSYYTDNPISANRRLITLTVSFSQESQDSTVVFMALRCRTVPLGVIDISSRLIGINRGTLYLYNGDGEVTKEVDENGIERSTWFAESKAVEFTDERGEIITIRGGGESKNPFWEINAEPEKHLDNVVLKTPYCTVENLQKGDVLMATFETYPKDASFVLVEKNNTLGEEVTREQQNIIDCLEKQSLSQGEYEDSAIFCQHKKTFMAGDKILPSEDCKNCSL